MKTINKTLLQTSDGKIFENSKSAELWEEILNKRKKILERFQIKEFNNPFEQPEHIYWIYINNIDEDKQYIEKIFKITSGLEFIGNGWNIATILGLEEIQFFNHSEIKGMMLDIKEHMFK